MRIFPATIAAATLLAAAACGTSTPARHAKTSTGGVVTSRASTQLADPIPPSCNRKPTPAGCEPRWALVIRDKAGKRHSLTVTQAAYSRCQLGEHYPACAKGGRS